MEVGGERPPGPDGGVGGGEDVVGHLEPGLTGLLIMTVVTGAAWTELPQPVPPPPPSHHTDLPHSVDVEWWACVDLSQQELLVSPVSVVMQ